MQWKVMKSMASGLAFMIFAVFFYYNVTLFVHGETLLIWLGVSWLIMVIGVAQVWLGISDCNDMIKKEKKETEENKKAELK